MTTLNEDAVEQAALSWLAELGFSILHGPDIAPDGPTPERDSYADVLLAERFQSALLRLNPHLSAETLEEAARKVRQTELPDLIAENRRLHRLIVEGVEVEVARADGSIGGDRARLVDFDDPAANDWLAVNQFTVIEHGHNRRPDVVLFVNGLPLVVIELKNPGNEGATLAGAFNQLQTYKAEIPSLFRTNGALITSDGLHARVGSLTADSERFMPWRTVDGKQISPKGAAELETVLRGVCAPDRLLELVRRFTVFGDRDGRLLKIIAGYHQFHAVREAVRCTLQAAAPGGDRKVGVIWHTQGSGKSLLMAFYAGRLIAEGAMENPTLVVITDRNDLDDQLFATFSLCRDLLRQTPQQAQSREELQGLLNRPSGGVIFTTMQKFAPETKGGVYPVLTERRNVVVIADEAHRSQYGFRARMDQETGEVGYGFAKYLRDALPNASFIGFTGTPIEADDVNTPAVFGNYIDIYDISRAVEDGATVPIFYESRLARVELEEAAKAALDEQVDEIADEEEIDEQAKARWARVEALVGAEPRLALVADDIVRHFEARIAGLAGKGMIVGMSRRICVALYDQIVALRPAWHHEADDQGAIKIVMTGSAADPQAWQRHIGGKARRDLLARRIKDPADPLRLVIVRDMWLTGFDAPCMHTLYVDKPMQGHGLMQAIARVNRVFRDKPSGLVVDYIGIAQRLKSALAQYSQADQRQVGIDEAEAVAALQMQLEIVRGQFAGFDWDCAGRATDNRHCAHGSAQSSAMEGKLRGNAATILPGTGSRPSMAGTTGVGEAAGAFRVSMQTANTPPAIQAALAAPASARLKLLALGLDWVLSRQEQAVREANDVHAKRRALRRFQDAVLGLSKSFALAAASDLARAVRDEVGFYQTLRAAMVKPSPGRRTQDEIAFAIQQIVSRAVISTEIVDILAAVGVQTPDLAILSDQFLAELAHLQQRNLALEALRKLLNGQIRSHARRNVVEARRFSERLEEAVARYHNNALTTAEVIQEMIRMAQEFRDAQRRGEETGLSPDEVAFYDALAQNESAVEVMGDRQLWFIAAQLLKSVRENATIDWNHRKSARAKMRVAIKRILKQYGYPPDMQDAAVRMVLEQAEVLTERWVGA